MPKKTKKERWRDKENFFEKGEKQEKEEAKEKEREEKTKIT